MNYSSTQYSVIYLHVTEWFQKNEWNFCALLIHIDFQWHKTKNKPSLHEYGNVNLYMHENETILCLISSIWKLCKLSFFCSFSNQDNDA